MWHLKWSKCKCVSDVILCQLKMGHCFYDSNKSRVFGFLLLWTQTCFESQCGDGFYGSILLRWVLERSAVDIAEILGRDVVVFEAGHQAVVEFPGHRFGSAAHQKVRQFAQAERRCHQQHQTPRSESRIARHLFALLFGHLSSWLIFFIHLWARNSISDVWKRPSKRLDMNF